MTREEFKRQIPTLETVYMLHSGFTKAPYVACNQETFDDEVFIYTEEDKAVEEAKRMTEQKQNAFVVKVEKKNLLRIFTMLYTYGMNGMVFIHKGNRFAYQLAEIVHKPEHTGNSNKQNPVENPQLQLCMFYFMQEVRRQLEHPNADALKELEEEMFVNVMRAKYLVPYREAQVDGKTQMQLVVIKLDNGIPMIPILTDLFEFAKFQGDQKLKVMTAGFDQLTAIPVPEEHGGFLINPAGVSVPITKGWVQKMNQVVNS